MLSIAESSYCRDFSYTSQEFRDYGLKVMEDHCITQPISYHDALQLYFALIHDIESYNY